MSKIEWTEKTWNPSIGCNKVSSGCQNCYAEVMAKRLQAMGNPDYKNGFRFTLLEHRLNYPKTVKKPCVFFVNSMSDLFHQKMPKYFLDKIFKTMEETPQHIYQILTKREKKMVQYCKNKKIPENVLLGVTVENKKTKNRIECFKRSKSEKIFIVRTFIRGFGRFGTKNY